MNRAEEDSWLGRQESLFCYPEEGRMKNQRDHARHHAVLILAIVGFISSAALMPGLARRVSAQAVAPSWSYTGNLNTARTGHTATLLQTGKVLVAGGINNSSNVVADFYTLNR